MSSRRSNSVLVSSIPVVAPGHLAGGGVEDEVGVDEFVGFLLRIGPAEERPQPGEKLFQA